MQRIVLPLKLALAIFCIWFLAISGSFAHAQEPLQNPAPSPDAGAIVAQGPGATNVTNGPPDSADLEKDPRLAQFDPPDRQFVVIELGTSEAYCHNDPVASGLLDCDCFAKVVFNYRLTHADDRISDAPNASAPSPASAATASAPSTPSPVQDAGNMETHPIGGGSTGPAPMLPLVNLAVSGEKLNCADCVSGAKAAKWASAEARKSLTSPLVEKPLHEPQLTQVANCVSKTFLASFHAKPFLSAEPSEFQHALADCRSPKR